MGVESTVPCANVEDVQRIVNFLTTFAETHAMILPGRVPGFKRDDVKLLPSHEQNNSVWRQYKTAMEGTGELEILIHPSLLGEHFQNEHQHMIINNGCDIMH